MCELPLLEAVVGVTGAEVKRIVSRFCFQAHVLGSELRYEVIRLQHKTKHKLLDFFPVEFTRNRKTTTEDLRSTYKSRFRRFVEPAELSFRVVAGDYRKTVEALLGSDAEVPLPNVPQPRIAKVLTLNTRKEDSAGLQLVIMLHVMNNKKKKKNTERLIRG